MAVGDSGGDRGTRDDQQDDQPGTAACEAADRVEVIPGLVPD
jgi:hypothetical protein